MRSFRQSRCPRADTDGMPRDAATREAARGARAPARDDADRACHRHDRRAAGARDRRRLIFGGTSRNRASLERAARLAENAHYAMEVMRNDIAQAGYYDTLTTTAGGFTWQLRDPCVTALADLGWSNPTGTPPPVNAKIENAPVRDLRDPRSRRDARLHPGSQAGHGDPRRALRRTRRHRARECDRRALPAAFEMRARDAEQAEPRRRVERPGDVHDAQHRLRARSPTSSASSSGPITSRIATAAASTRSRR